MDQRDYSCSRKTTQFNIENSTQLNCKNNIFLTNGCFSKWALRFSKVQHQKGQKWPQKVNLDISWTICGCFCLFVHAPWHNVGLKTNFDSTFIHLNGRHKNVCLIILLWTNLHIWTVWESFWLQYLALHTNVCMYITKLDFAYKWTNIHHCSATQYDTKIILKMSIAASFLLSVGVLMTEVTMLIMVVVLIHVIIGKSNF